LVDQGLISLAFAAGLVAALNPCGFAMLPAYLVLVVRGERADSPGPAAAGRAVVATAAMSMGFLTVFGLFGALTISAGATVQRYLPYLVVVIGVVVVALGIWLLSGRELTLASSRRGRWAPTARLGSMYGYGVSYAIASLSCTVGPFLAVTAAGLRRGSLIGSASIYLSYVAGLTLVVGALAVAAAIASSAVLHRLRRILPYVHRIGGALMVLVGLYVGYYASYEIRLHNANAVGPDALLAAAGRLQGAVAGWVHQHGGWPWLLAFTMLMTAVFVGALLRRTRRRWSGLPQPAAAAAPPVTHDEEQRQGGEADQVPVFDVADLVAVQHRQQQPDNAQPHDVPGAVVDSAPAPVRRRHISDVDPAAVALHLGTGHGNSSGLK
jgi:cytochrome c biogenesis protein CcdA